MSLYNTDQLRHSDSDSDSRYHAWPGSSSSSASYYQGSTSSDPRYHAFGSYYASHNQSNSHYPYRVGEYTESQQSDDHQHMWQSQEHSGAPSSSSVATSSPPNLQDDAYGWSPAEGGDQNRCHCGKAFRRPSDLAKHQKYHIKYFSCLFSGCDKAFATQKDLTRHMRTHRKGEGYQCKVDGCRKAMSGHVYSRKDNFDRHMRTAHPEHPQI